MANTERPKTRVLLVRIDEGTQYNLPHRYANVFASAGVLEDGRFSGPDSWVREGSEPKRMVPMPALKDLKVAACMATNMESTSYGWDVEYRQPFTVDLETAERMLKALKQVRRGLDKTHELIGRPASFGQYLARVARTLDVAFIMVERFEYRNARYGTVSDEERYLTLSPSQAVAVVDGLIATWHQTYPSTRERYEADLAAAG